MNEDIHSNESWNNALFLERLDFIDSLVAKFRRQVQQITSLKQKISLLQEELKKLEISVKTQTKAIELKFEDFKENSDIVLTEAYRPGSDEWECQHLFRNLVDEYQDFKNHVETWIEKLDQESS